MRKLDSIECELTECDRTCWCRFCKVNIKPNTRYLTDLIKGYKGGFARINICLNCLKTLVDGFTEQDKDECNEIKKRVLALAIEK